MRTLCVSALLAFSFAASLQADTREVVKTTFGEHQTVSTRYVQGKNTRFENPSPNGAPPFISIYNSEQNKTYLLDLHSQTYVELQPQSPDWILSFAQWIARPPRMRESGKTVNVYYETIDTGERKTFFGYTARHFLLREQHVAEPGACDGTYQSGKDGWYIRPTESNTGRTAAYLVGMIAAGSYQCHDTVVSHGNPMPPGYPVLETDGSFTREVVQLSYDPLDKNIFTVPSDFQKVRSLPGQPAMSWSRHLALEWAQLERAFQSWFE